VLWNIRIEILPERCREEIEKEKEILHTHKKTLTGITDASRYTDVLVTKYQ
jgi:hypothetical protein